MDIRVSFQKNRNKVAATLVFLFWMLLLPTGHAYASRPNMLVSPEPTEFPYASRPDMLVWPEYSVHVYENGIWKSVGSELIYGGNEHACFDGHLHFVPLSEYVKQKEFTRITPSDDFCYRVASKNPDVSVDYSYRIYDPNWECVLEGEETNPDLSGLDAGEYLLYITVSAKMEDAYELSAFLTWLMIGE